MSCHFQPHALNIMPRFHQCKFVPAVYRFQQVSDIVYQRSKQQQQEGDEDKEEEEAQSLDLWLLNDSTLAQLMDPSLAAPAVQFMVLEVMPCMWAISSAIYLNVGCY